MTRWFEDVQIEHWHQPERSGYRGRVGLFLVVVNQLRLFPLQRDGGCRQEHFSELEHELERYEDCKPAFSRTARGILILS